MTDLSRRLLDLHAQTTKLKWTNDAPGCVGGHYPQGGKRTIAICGGGELADTEDRADAAFIAEAHESVPALCAEIDSLEKRIEKIKQTIRDGIECANASGHSEFERRLMASTLSMALFQIEHVI